MLKMGRIYPKWFHALKKHETASEVGLAFVGAGCGVPFCVFFFAENYLFFCSNVL